MHHRLRAFFKQVDHINSKNMTFIPCNCSSTSFTSTVCEIFKRNRFERPSSKGGRQSKIPGAAKRNIRRNIISQKFNTSVNAKRMPRNDFSIDVSAEAIRNILKQRCCKLSIRLENKHLCEEAKEAIGICKNASASHY